MPSADRIRIFALASPNSRRKVLIIEDEPSIRNVLYVLLAGLGCDGDVAHNTDQAVDMIRQDQFDAILLDLRSAPLPKMDSEIRKLQPSLVGRVLVITGEVADQATMEMLERYAVPHIPRSRVSSDLWGRLRTLLGFTRSADSASH